jgi:signal transduction histidine kinase
MKKKSLITFEKVQNILRFPEFNYSVMMLFLVFLTMGIITSYAYTKIKSEHIQETKDEASHTSENVRQYLLGLISRGNNYINQSEVILLNYKLRNINLSPLEISKILDDLLPNDSEFELLIMSKQDGHYLANSQWNSKPQMMESQKSTTLLDRDYFTMLQKNSKIEFFISNPIKSKTTGKWILVIAKRRYDLNANFIGEDHVTVSIEKVAAALKLENLDSESTIAIYNSENELLVRNPLVEEKLGKKVPVVAELEPFLADGKKNLIGFCPIDKFDKIFGYSLIKELGIRILWGKSYEKVIAPVNAEFKIIGLIELILLLIAIFYLLSKYKNLEEIEILQIQESNHSRMAMIGEFAAGVAHEINNPLTIIIGNAQSLITKNELENTSAKENRVKKIIEMSERVSKIVKSLKNLGHSSQADDFVDYEFNQVINDVLQIVNIKLKESEIKFNNLVSEGLIIRCVPALMSQVLLNLFSNSIYAVSSLPEKWIELKTENDDENIYIHFTDSGHGIPKHIQAKLMSTFYTTKPIGVGTGLGLSICKRIIKQQGGEFYIAEDHANTRFTISFPIVVKKV